MICFALSINRPLSLLHGAQPDAACVLGSKQCAPAANQTSNAVEGIIYNAQTCTPNVHGYIVANARAVVVLNE